MGVTESTAIIGLDGLARRDVEEFDFTGQWDDLEIETAPHTFQSWNAIFSGRVPEGTDEFHKPPEEPPDDPPEKMSDYSERYWSYDEIYSDSYLWEQAGVDVVVAPIVMPTYSTLPFDPGNLLTWPSGKGDFSHSMETLTKLTLQRDHVITVFPMPDHMHHLLDLDGEYSEADLAEQMAELDDCVRRLTDEFDRWVLLSDHGRPGGRAYTDDGNWWFPAHEPTGVIRSNVMDTEGLTNVTVYERLLEFLQ